MPRKATAKVATKAIAETVATTGTARAVEAASAVGRNAQYKSLSAREIYELDVAARTAANAYAHQIGSCAKRLFSRASGDEITSGPTYDFIRRNVTTAFVREQTMFNVLEGERAAWRVPGATRGGPQRLLTLDPGYLRHDPPQARAIELVKTWVYSQPYVIPDANDGSSSFQLRIPVEQVMFSHTFNPNQPLRGLSLLSAGIMQASTTYFAHRFNAMFFQNGAHRDVVLRFPKGTKLDVVKDVVGRWSAEHSIFNGNGFSVSGVVAEEMEILEPASLQKDKDGGFMNLKQSNDDDIASLLGVPASIMGNYARTRFDTYEAEKEIFFQYRIMPEATDFSEWVQKDLIDVEFLHADAPKGKKEAPRFLSRAMRRAFERAMDENPESEVVFLLDPDVLPIGAELRQKQFLVADQYRRTQGVSFKDAAEMMGIDRPSNDADDLIAIPNDQIIVNGEQPTPAVSPAPPPQVGDESDGGSEKALESHGAAFEAAFDAVAGAVKAYRAYVCECADRGEVYDKRTALDLLRGAGSPSLLVSGHADYLALRAIVRSDAAKAEKLRQIKDYLNKTYRKAALRSLAAASPQGGTSE